MPRIILDTDLAMGAPGSDVDDGFALALAHADPDITIEMITTVNGNADVASATILTAELCRRLDLDVPIVKGAAGALTRPGPRPIRPEAVALANQVPEPHPGYAAAEIIKLIMNNPGEVTLVPIGPLTNIAVALALEPQIAENVAEIVIMGGAFFRPKMHHSMPGEFNVWMDPEAARAVLRCGAPQRWVGQDVTNQVRLSKADAARMSAAATPFAQFAGASAVAWIDHVAADQPGSREDQDSCALHDPLAVAVLTRPDLVQFRPAAVEVLTGEDFGRGVMITDLLTAAQPPPANCQVAESVDAQGFSEHFVSLIAQL